MVAGLSNLPPDVLLEISQSLDAGSAIHLLQTCRELYNLSNFRAFWVEKLQALIKEHSLPDKTFDITSATLPQIRAAVSRPYRFERDLKARKFSKRTPLQLAYRHNYTWNAALIPGGRWLAVVAKDIGDIEGPTLRIFDITPPTTINFKPVAELYVDCSQRVKLHVDPRPNGTIICLATHRGDPDFPETVFLIVKFDELDLSLVGNDELVSPEILLNDPCIYKDFLAVIFNDNTIQTWRWDDGYCEHIGTGDGLCAFICALQREAIACWCPQDHYLTIHGPVGRDQPEGTPAADLDMPSRYMDLLAEADFNANGLPYAELQLNPVDAFHIPGTTTSSSSLFIIMKSCATLLTAPDLSSEPDGLERVDNKNYSYDDLFSNDAKRSRIARQTISGHVVTVSNDNELCIFDAFEDLVERYALFMDAPRQTMGKRHPFLCPATGVLGSVSDNGTFYIWRARDS